MLAIDFFKKLEVKTFDGGIKGLAGICYRICVESISTLALSDTREDFLSFFSSRGVSNCVVFARFFFLVLASTLTFLILVKLT